jgi:hypothetical protein
MTATNKKIDAIRKLILGPFYTECRDNPLGVKREDLEAHFEELKREGCVGGDCGFDEMIKLCQLKSHYPSCLSDNRGCIENIGERSTGVKKFYYEQYKRAKQIEDEPDESSSDEDEIECPVCTMNEDENGVRLVEMVTNPEEEQGKLSCGHLVHKSCLIKTAVSKGRDRAECPLCNTIFELNEVQVPVRDASTLSRDNMRRAVFNGTQMGRTFEEIADVYGLDIEQLLERIGMTAEEASAYYSIPLESIEAPVNRRLDFDDDDEEDESEEDENEDGEEDEEEIPIIDALIAQNYELALELIIDRNGREEDWVSENVFIELFSRIKEQTDLINVQELTYIFNEIMGESFGKLIADNLNETYTSGVQAQKVITKDCLELMMEHNFTLIFRVITRSLQKSYFELCRAIFDLYLNDAYVAQPSRREQMSAKEVIIFITEDILDNQAIMSRMEDRDGAVDLINEFFGEESYDE